MKRIALPLIVGLVVVLATVGIVLGNAIIDRTIHVTVIESITVSPSEDTPVTVFKGEYIDTVFTISNPSPTPHTVTCTWDTLPTGITVVATPASVYLPPQGVDSITVRVAADDTASSSSDVVLHFTVT